MIGIDGAYDPSNSYRRDARTFYIPLQFFFCTNPGLSLPIIALQYHEVQIVFNFRKFEDMLTLTRGDSGSDSKTINTILYDNPNIRKDFNIELFVDYVYLDVDERRRMAQSSHEMLVTQTKRISHMIQSNIESDRIDLKNLNHPVKELIWVTKVNHGEVNRDYFDFGYSDSNNAIGRDGVVNTGFYETHEIMKQASITLNGNDRVEKRDSMFYRCIQPYQHHTRIPNNYIYVYSFALKPEEVQPSGSCNFSRIDNAYLNVDNNTENLDGGIASDAYEYVVYALNWNVLRIQSGQGGIAFTN